ncbi:MAG: glycosyltransferase [Gemmataceae bacterium]
MTTLGSNHPSSLDKLHVVHVTWGFQVGGLEKLLVEIARLADPDRIDLKFLSIGTRGELTQTIESHGWPVVVLNRPTGFHPGLVPRIAALFRKWRPDVVHTHNTRALFYAGPASKLARVPQLFHTWHGVNLRGSPREALFFRILGWLPQELIAVSHDAAEKMANLGIPNSKIQTIWNGIDLDKFAYAGPNPSGPIITVARLSPEKDIQTLVRAIHVVKQQKPDVRLEIVGDGVCMSDLRDLTSELGLDENIHFHGQSHEVPKLLQRSSLFVLPSLTEGVSLTILEAMARGLPVIATNVGGNPEVVAEGVTGLLVPSQSSEKLAEAILRLWEHPGEQQAMGQAGRNRVEEHFTIRGMVETYEARYRERYGPRPLVQRGVAKLRRPKVLANIEKLPFQSDLVDAEYFPIRTGSKLEALCFWVRSFQYDAVVLDQETSVLRLLALLRMLTAFFNPPFISLDLVLAPPGDSLLDRVKAMLRRAIFSQVDLFLMHLKYHPRLESYYGITPKKLRYIPFKVNQVETVRAWETQEHEYVFTGGKSRRDYHTFCEALKTLGYPALIVTPKPEEGTEHGTFLDGLALPSNVELIHDDGSQASWIGKIANCKVAVFPISPVTISPSGVGAYLLAMGLKKCVIVSDCPSTRDILEHDNNAVLVPMSDSKALARAIEKVWTDKEYRHRIAEGGHQYSLTLGGEETLARNVAKTVLNFLGGESEAEK